MTNPVKPRRSYVSTVRREQAAATRSAVLGAAGSLFAESGYVATTVDAIAARAGVSAETVYAVFGSKRALLAALVDVTIAGDDAPVPILDRSWVQRLANEPDAERALRILARNGRGILERITPIYEILVGAAAADRQAADVLARYREQRLAAQRTLVRMIGAKHRLRTGLSRAAAADIVFTLGSPECFGLLVRDRGWTPGRWERWYADTLKRLLLG